MKSHVREASILIKSRGRVLSRVVEQPLQFQFSKPAAILSDVGLEGSVYFVCQRGEAGISRMKFVRPVIFGLQRSSDRHAERREAPLVLEHRVQRIYER
jgi:hypothetical protein